MSLAKYLSLMGGDQGVYQTVGTLKGLVYAALRDPQARIRKRAESILGGTPERDEQAEVSAIFYFVQNSLHYIDDPFEIELVKDPLLIDQEITDNGYFMGDCDDATGYLASLLKSVGYQVQMVVVTPDNAPGYDYRHIYVRVWMPKAQDWMALDATAKIFEMGWEVPNKKERAFDL